MTDSRTARRATFGQRCGVACTVLLSTCFGAAACSVLGRKRRLHGERSSAMIGEILPDCENLSSAVIQSICSEQPERQLPSGWECLTAQLLELERRTTDAANAARESHAQRSFDQLAGALIALRGALEADVRLRGRPGTPHALRAAGDDLVIARCEDVAISARALGGPPR